MHALKNVFTLLLLTIDEAIQDSDSSQKKTRENTTGKACEKQVTVRCSSIIQPDLKNNIFWKYTF